MKEENLKEMKLLFILITVMVFIRINQVIKLTTEKYLLATNPSHLACFITLYFQWERISSPIVEVTLRMPSMIQANVSSHSVLWGTGVKHISLCWPL